MDFRGRGTRTNFSKHSTFKSPAELTIHIFICEWKSDKKCLGSVSLLNKHKYTSNVPDSNLRPPPDDTSTIQHLRTRSLLLQPFHYVFCAAFTQHHFLYTHIKNLIFLACFHLCLSLVTARPSQHFREVITAYSRGNQENSSDKLDCRPSARKHQFLHAYVS